MRYVFTSFCLLLICPVIIAQQINIYAGGQMILASGNPVSWSGLTLIPSTSFNLNSGINQSTTIINAFPAPYILRVYQFDPASASFNGSIGIHYLDGELNGIDKNNLNLFVNNGTPWQGFPPSLANPAGNYLQVDGISSLPLGEVLLAASSALPLTWGTASILREGASIKIKWTTSQERDVSHFDVERSSDAAAWRIAITGIPARNQLTETRYEATDRPGNPGRLYYRVRQTDNDGRYTFSRILVAPGENEQGSIFITPNPASGFFLVSTSDISRIQQLYLVSNAGMVMHSWRGGQYQYQLPPVPAGSYFLRIHLTDGSSQIRTIQIR